MRGVAPWRNARSDRLVEMRRHSWRETLRSVRLASRVVSVEIRAASEVTPELVDAVARLVPQLSSSSPPPTAEQLAEIVDNRHSVLFLAVDTTVEGAVEGAADSVIGALTLAFYRLPTGLKAWIEDVVVDEAGRGRGVGAALNEAAIDEARRRGAKHVSLTSRPSREVANRLYQRLGFDRYETNVYRFSL